MEKIHISETKYTPEIILDPFDRNIKIRGSSYPENTFEFYHETMDWIEEFLKEESEKPIIVELEIAYFNSSSSKLLFDFFTLFEDAQDEGRDIQIYWKYNIENDYGKRDEI
jgi:hypothetical protein